MTLTGVLVAVAVVTSAVSVRVLQPSNSAEVLLLLTSGGPVVRTKPVLCSLARYEVPCWFWVLKPFIPVEASVDVSTAGLDICPGVPVTEPPVGETIGGADEADTCTGRSVLGCVALKGGVESDDACCEVVRC